MNVFELAAALGGEVVNGELRVRENDTVVSLGNNYELNDEGKKRAEKVTAQPETKPAPKKRTATAKKTVSE